jgi:hypothetical protein
MVGRTSLGEITDSEFSNLLHTLSASTKGRAFLTEYRRRSRPEETETLLASLARIEGSVAALREQLQPESIADELRRIAMTLEIAMDGAEADPDGDETARRMALVETVRREICAVAEGLSAKAPPRQAPPAPRAEPARAEPAAIAEISDRLAIDLDWGDQLGTPLPDRPLFR